MNEEAHLGEPPPEGRYVDTKVGPGDDAVHHDEESQKEEHQYDLLLAGQRCIHLAAITRKELRFVGFLHVVNQRFARILAYPLGVAHDPEDANRRPNDEHDESTGEAIGNRSIREPGCNTGRERIDGRTQHADAGAEQEDGGARERVVSRRDHHRHDERIEGEGLLGHPIRGAAKGEHDHEDRDHQFFPALERAHQAVDPGVDRTGLHRDAQKAADDDDEQGDVDCSIELAVVERVDVAGLILDAVHPLDGRSKGIAHDSRRIGVDLVVGTWNRRALAVEIVEAGRYEIARNGDEDDQDEEDRVRTRHLEPVLLLLDGHRRNFSGSRSGSICHFCFSLHDD